ncbi:DUF6531 domain-containing protein [Aquabacterium sp. CECT 9606]|uniref:DUF6531 domain-containing protein n=1 Tax=Aquabacterium sp. CECT 9606 TaxID=2845822 RepID=UPI001E5245E1|nr:DUF6531 domain-containing protein [Aquabacterium sp. CECT 9606]CAH0353091.1 hypothetical protein AQB9606_03057 [Aquabacterium sp. CECT 9606]
MNRNSILKALACSVILIANNAEAGDGCGNIDGCDYDVPIDFDYIEAQMAMLPDTIISNSFSNENSAFSIYSTSYNTGPNIQGALPTITVSGSASNFNFSLPMPTLFPNANIGTPGGGGGGGEPGVEVSSAPVNDECKTARPVVIRTGTKVRTDVDVKGAHRSALYVKRTFNSKVASTLSSFIGIFGPGWVSNLDLRLIPIFRDGSTCNTMPGSYYCEYENIEDVHAFMRISSNGIYAYARDGGAMRRVDSTFAYETINFDDNNSMWWIKYQDGTIEKYAMDGRLISITDRYRNTIIYDYAYVNKLTSVTHSNGSQISLGWTGDRVTSATDMNGNVVNYGYTNGILTTVTYPGPTPTASAYTYHYDTTVDKFVGVSIGGARYTINDYYPDGKAYHSGLVGGLEKDTFSYGTNTDGSYFTQVTDVNNLTAKYTFKNIGGAERLIKVDRGAGVGCSAAGSSQAYDPSGLLVSRDDFNNHKTCYKLDAYENELARVEGLPNTAVCSSVLADGATLPAGARKISTKLHPDWFYKIDQFEPYRRTTWVYNGQPDPTNNNALASCAPENAVLPDGKKIAVLCKKIERATLDANGSAGLGASMNNVALVRVNNYTYNETGQVLTYTDTNGNKTGFVYHSDVLFTGIAPNMAGHSKGDLKEITDAKGFLTQFTSYDKSGRLLGMTDVNGVNSTYSYNARGQVQTMNQAGQQISFEYWPTGLLKKAIQADGSSLSYTYDAALRLTDVKDNLGNSVHYTLDDAGNRLSEDVKDNSATPVLTRNITRTYDALNRVRTLIGAGQ